MRAPPLRWLVADSAKLVVLVVAVPAALSRRLWPNAVTGTADRNLNHTFLLFNLSNNERHRLAWSDSVAFGMESLTCGDRLKKFNTTVMLFGNDG
ncbi:hypothetical protein I4F81_007287 [Pyropia yezoensis]|uniref:Uncharacterized protein n=1 Tax=Pyropia yezoensis TaxID=2788 RepID=A0ACC3C3R2_PYRYE|nr:hypothetical protein I4F81_007287 [Neopyropia yezoensis]